MKTPEVPFGKIEHMAWWTIKTNRNMNQAGIEWLGKELCKLTGMVLHGEPDVRDYPTPDGQGGVGIQIYFPWVESWMIISTWPELGIMRIAMSTCAVERFVPQAVYKFLEVAVGHIQSYGFAEW